LEAGIRFSSGWFWSVAIVVLTAAAYSSSLHGAFIYDDIEGITQNLSFRHWATLLHPPEGITPSGRPLLNASLGLSFAISGVSVWGYHVVNVAIHAAAALALFGVLRWTHPAIAGPAALLWAVHPLLTESVTYVVQRAESMMGLFYLLTLYCFARWRTLPPARSAYAWLSVLFCWLGMATKEVMVTAPVVVFLYDRTFVAGSFRAAWAARRGYYLALASSWILLAALIAGSGGNRGGTIGFGVGISPVGYALTQMRAIATYLRLSVWPHPLVIDYGPLWMKSAAQAAPYALPVLGALAIGVWALIRRPVLGFWLAWFFIILSPTSSFVPGTTQIIVEHRMYLSLIAVPVLAALALSRWSARWTTPLLGAIAALFAALTFARNQAYGTEGRLWQETVAQVPDNPNAHDALGLVLMREGKIDEAMAEFRTAQRLNPDLIAPLENLGDADVKRGQYQAALEEFEAAIQKNPRYAPVHVDLGNLLLLSRQYEAAIAQYAEALRLQPGSAEAECNWGLALSRSGRTPESLPHFEAALRLNPAFAEAEFNWGNAARVLGQTSAAMAHYARALELRPDYAEPALNWGNLLLQQNRLPEAIARFRRALQLAPESADAHNSLALALARNGQVSAAIAECEAALRLRPGFPAAEANIILFRRQAGSAE
jgi:tetratricopeptide (TPR) repeat protein